MASRVAGAVLALTAAALLAVSVVAAGWWGGHPTFKGVEIKAKEITVTPLGATGCNTGGDGACMSVPVDATFETIGYGLAGVVGLLGVIALVLAVLTLRGRPRRKTLAVFVIVGAMIAAALAVVLVAIGPQLRTEAPLPFSIGLYVFFGGITCALASSLFAMRNPPPAQVQLAPARQSLQQLPQVPAPTGGLDVQALLSEDALRPSSLGPEPMMGRGSPVHSPGGALPGPSGPLGAIGASGPQPLFSSAPQLRPLYEAAPGQGGTGGFVPKPPASFPLRAPTPIPRDQISAHAGIPTPASLEVQRPVTAAISPPPPPAPPPSSDATDRDLLGLGRKPATLPPPNRNMPMTSPPPGAVMPPPKSPTIAVAAVPPPPNPTVPRLESEDGTFDAMQTYQRDPAPPKPPPPRPAARPTAVKAAAMPPPRPIVPMPARATPPPPVRATPPPARPATPRPPTRLLTEDAAVDTDVSSNAVDDDAPATESFETATSESTGFAQQPRAPSVSSTMETTPAPAEDDDELATRGREKIAATDLELPTVRPPTETEAPAASPDPVPPAARSSTKLPISTAPDSLPPPTEKQAAASGPSPACPQCEAPMAWVEAHLRFYCKSCKMYF